MSRLSKHIVPMRVRRHRDVVYARTTEERHGRLAASLFVSIFPLGIAAMGVYILVAEPYPRSLFGIIALLGAAVLSWAILRICSLPRLSLRISFKGIELVQKYPREKHIRATWNDVERVRWSPDRIVLDTRFGEIRCVPEGMPVDNDALLRETLGRFLSSRFDLSDAPPDEQSPTAKLIRAAGCYVAMLVVLLPIPIAVLTLPLKTAAIVVVTVVGCLVLGSIAHGIAVPSRHSAACAWRYPRGMLQFMD